MNAVDAMVSMFGLLMVIGDLDIVGIALRKLNTSRHGPLIVIAQ